MTNRNQASQTRTSKTSRRLRQQSAGKTPRQRREAPPASTPAPPPKAAFVVSRVEEHLAGLSKGAAAPRRKQLGTLVEHPGFEAAFDVIDRGVCALAHEVLAAGRASGLLRRPLSADGSRLLQSAELEFHLFVLRLNPIAGRDPREAWTHYQDRQASELKNIQKRAEEFARDLCQQRGLRFGRVERDRNRYPLRLLAHGSPKTIAKVLRPAARALSLRRGRLPRVGDACWQVLWGMATGAVCAATQYSTAHIDLGEWAKAVSLASESPLLEPQWQCEQGVKQRRKSQREYIRNDLWHRLPELSWPKCLQTMDGTLTCWREEILRSAMAGRRCQFGIDPEYFPELAEPPADLGVGWHDGEKWRAYVLKETGAATPVSRRRPRRNLMLQSPSIQAAITEALGALGGEEERSAWIGAAILLGAHHRRLFPWGKCRGRWPLDREAEQLRKACPAR